MYVYTYIHTYIYIHIHTYICDGPDVVTSHVAARCADDHKILA